MKKNNLYVFLTMFNTAAVGAMIFGMLRFLDGLELYIRIGLYISIGILYVLSVVFAIIKKESWFKSVFALNMTLLVIVTCFSVLSAFGVFRDFSDMENIKKLILDSGSTGKLIFILMQILQIVILPAPGFLFYAVGAAIYGPFEGFILSSLGVIAGSVISFSIGKLCGRRVVAWCIGKEATEKYSEMLGSKGKLLFIMMQLLPCFPDDVLCMAAGLSAMSYPFFIITISIVRPIYIAAVSWLGTGDIIPFRGWGIPVWILIFAVCGVIFVLYAKNQEKVENFMKRIFRKDK